MKKEYKVILLNSLLLGGLIGIALKSYKVEENTLISNDNIIKKEIKSMNNSIGKLLEEKENLEEILKKIKQENLDNSTLNKINAIKMNLGYIDIYGEGITLLIDSSYQSDFNIATIVEAKNILINIVNELKINGGEFISINNQTLNQYSEIVLAGNHININSTPIAPPYEIKAIGDKELLYNDLKNNHYIESIEKDYPIKISISRDDRIKLNKIEIPRKLKYIGGN